MHKGIATALLTAALASGCSLAPELTRPDMPTPAEYPGQPKAFADEAPASGERRAVDTGWREFFPDPRLQSLIEAALENNRDLRQAVLNIEAARALYGIQRSERLPSVDAEASYTRQRTPGSLSPTDTASYSSRYQVGLAVAAYELDFFGRVRSLSEAALREYLATEEAARAAQISIVAEVARAYLAERALAEQLRLAEDTVAAREDSYRLAQLRYQAGASSALDLRQQETLLESARVSVAALARQHAQAQNALTLLVGAQLEDLPEPRPLAQQGIVADIPPGLPSDLLAQRPDIRAAEHRLIGANASIGAARAAFFPRISLTGSVGVVSDELSDLFGSGTGTWSFIPRITLPIFNAGRNRANLDLAEVRKEQAVVSYEQAIQQAFREVADALVARGALEAQVRAQERLRAAQAERLRLAEERYEGGIASYLDVLDAQRELFAAEQALVQVEQLRLANAVDLYRSLGGGLLETGAAPSESD